MERCRGFGHSTWQQGVKLCEAAGAKRLALFHHDHGRTDSQLDAMEKQAKSRFRRLCRARRHSDSNYRTVQGAALDVSAPRIADA